MSRTLHSLHFFALPPPKSLFAPPEKNTRKQKRIRIRDIDGGNIFAYQFRKYVVCSWGPLRLAYIHMKEKNSLGRRVQRFKARRRRIFTLFTSAAATESHIKESQNSTDNSFRQGNDIDTGDTATISGWKLLVLLNLLKFFISHSLGARLVLESLILLSFAYTIQSYIQNLSSVVVAQKLKLSHKIHWIFCMHWCKNSPHTRGSPLDSFFRMRESARNWKIELAHHTQSGRLVVVARSLF